MFLTRSGTWSETIDDAALALEPQAAAALEARAKDDEKATLVTGAYLIDAERRERPGPRRPHPRAHARPWTDCQTGPRQAGRRHGRAALPRPKEFERMYRYDEFDHQFVRDRTNQFRDQADRRLKGELTEDEFRPLRLMNGLYLQLHAYMLRVAIPYGTLSSKQMRQLAFIADKWDKGYGHFTTRQNIQYNWIKLEDTADILDALADVEMHAIQTSGNCIRNVTTDHWAGAAADEIADPRPVGELLRQWSSLHPEFSFLPRKFKIAVTGAPNDRAAVKVHDIGLRLHKNAEGDIGWEVIVGGGLGRTPMIGVTVRDFLPEHELIGYLEAIMRVYNLYGRRDNKYKARIKILVHELGADKFKAEVEAEYARRPQASTEVEERELQRIAAYFAAPQFEKLPRWSARLRRSQAWQSGILRAGRRTISAPTAPMAMPSSTSR